MRRYGIRTISFGAWEAALIRKAATMFTVICRPTRPKGIRCSSANGDERPGPPSTISAACPAF